MILKLRPLTLWLLPCLVPAWSAMANEAEIEKIYVHGQRISAERLLLTEEDWQKRQARDLEDLFADQSAVAVGGALGVAQKLYLHGLEDLLLNVSIDGAVQSGSMFHHIGRLTLEPELLRQVEVQAGPGDATQGAGALGGSIDFITKDASDLLLPGERFAADGDASIIWEGHKAGRDIGYGQMEKLANLESLPASGFVVSCFPYKIKHASAGFVRAVAIFEQ